MHMSTKLTRLLVSATALLAFATTGVGSADAKVRKGDRAASFVGIKDGQGKTVKLSSYKDRLVVLTFGASWCKPCKKELPAFEKLAKKYDVKQVAFIAVNVDEELASGKAFVKKSGLKKVKAVFDPKQSTVKSFDPPTMPTTFIIKNGIVKEVHAGYRDGDVGKIEKIIAKELK